MHAESKSRSRRVIFSVGTLGFSAGLGALIGLGTQIVLARSLSPDAFGALSTATAVVGLVGPVAGFGMGQYWLQLFGHAGWSGLPSARKSLWVCVVSTLLAVGSIVVVAHYGAYDPLTRTFLLLLTPVVLSQATTQLAQARAQLEDRALAVAWLQLGTVVPRTVGAAIALTVSSAAIVATGYGAAGVALALATAWYTSRMFEGQFRLVGHGLAIDDDLRAPALTLRHIAAEAVPYVVANAMFVVFFQIDMAMLGWMKGAEAVAPYSLAVTIVQGVYILPQVVSSQYLLPRMHRWAAQSGDRLRTQVQKTSQFLGVFGVVVACVVALLSRPMMASLFGATYGESASVLMLLSAAIPFRYLSISRSAGVVAGVGPGMKVTAMAAAAVTNILLNLLLIPKYSFYGSAAATVLSEAVLAALYAWIARVHLAGNRMARR